MPASDKVFGPTLKEMKQFMAAKFGLPPAVAQDFILQVFRYIHGEVFTHGQTISIPGFGTFRRINKPAHPGSPEDALLMTHSIGIVRSGRKKFEDEQFEDLEDAGPPHVRQLTDSLVHSAAFQQRQAFHERVAARKLRPHKKSSAKRPHPAPHRR